MGWQVDGDGDQVSPSLCAQCANQYLVQELCKSFIMGSRKLVTTEILMRAIESVPPPRVRHRPVPECSYSVLDGGRQQEELGADDAFY